MTIITEIFVRTIDMRVAVRTIMIGNSYTEVGKMFVWSIRELKTKSKN